MNGKHGRHKRAPPQCPGHLPKNEEQQEHRRRVQQDVGQMMPARIQTKELAVKHVGQGGQGMPIAAMAVCERPDDALPMQPLGDGRILVNVPTIVVNEAVVQSLAEDGPDGQCQKKTNREVQQPILRLRFRRGRLDA